MFRYYFKTKPISPADMPKNPESVTVYDKPRWEHKLECEVWGIAEYDHPVQHSEQVEFALIPDALNRVRYTMKG